MAIDDNKTDFFKYLVDTYPVKERFISILKQIQDVLEAMNLMGSVNINTQLLGKAILDYFEDVDRLKKYENIDKINVEKIYAYEAFWLIRRHPIQIVDNELEEKYLLLNEKIFTFIMLAKMFRELQVSYDDKNPKLEKFIELLFYNFKYRIFTQKSLELMIAAFFCGANFKKTEMYK